MRRSPIVLVNTDDLDSVLQEFLDYCRTKNLSPHTIGYYRDRLRQFLGFCLNRLGVTDINSVSSASVRAYLADAVDSDYPTATINHAIKAARAFFNYLVDEGRLQTSPLARTKLLRAERKIIQTFSTDHINRLLSECNRKTFVGLRDYAMMLTMLDTGLRVSELCGLKTADIDWSTDFLRVWGKGSKERFVPFGTSVRKALREYLARKGDINAEGNVFVSHFAEPLDRRVVRVILRKLGEKARLSGVRVSPHTLRHTFAKNWILNGGDPFSLQRMLGHTTQQMVSQYVNLAAEDIQLQHSKFSPADRLSQAATGRRVVLR
jgi:integrase/recombinase XerD